MLKPFADEDSVYRLLESVQRAPSVHNTQPWYFRIAADDRIDICARFGDGTDAEFTMDGNGLSPAMRRELIISCGAALYNLRLAVRVTGDRAAAWSGDLPVGLGSVENVLPDGTAKIALTSSQAASQDVVDEISALLPHLATADQALRATAVRRALAQLDTPRAS